MGGGVLVALGTRLLHKGDVRGTKLTVKWIPAPHGDGGRER
jgi:hypothetical protein